MNSEDIVEAVCRLPVDVHRLRDKSPLQLLEMSGCLQQPNAVTEESIKQVLAAHPEWIDDWVMWSLDKRTSEGWYLLRRYDLAPDKGWEVGYHPYGERYFFGDELGACAFFVRREIVQMRSFIEKRHS